MPTNPEKPASVDDYISRFAPEVREILETIRQTVREAAPEAEEVISYQMPAFKQHGILVYFAAWKKHIGLYPPISGSESLKKSAERYAGEKGNLQFPLDEPIPYDLIQRIVKHRVRQNEAKRKSRGKRKS